MVKKFVLVWFVRLTNEGGEYLNSFSSKVTRNTMDVLYDMKGGKEIIFPDIRMSLK